MILPPARLEVLVSAEEIKNRVTDLAHLIRTDVGSETIVLIGVLKGAFPFLADLAREIPGRVMVDFMQVSSWEGGRESTGTVRIIKDHDMDIEGKHVVLVEDIVDSGRTVNHLRQLLGTRNPASLRVAALLSKPDAHIHTTYVDYVGFEIADRFVVGYGLDDKELYRNLPYIALLSGSSDPG